MKQINPRETRTPRVKSGRRLAGWSAAILGTAAFATVLTWSGIEAFQRNSQPVPLAATESDNDAGTLGKRPAPAINLQLPETDYEVVGTRPDAAPSQATPGRETQAPPRDIQPVTPADRDRSGRLPDNVKYDRQGNVIYVNGKPWTGEVFDHKPIRPVRTRNMKTTAYSPDHRSCGKWADGITASGKSVWMNGGRLVAADRDIPYGTILTVPGYNDNKPVQVWDRGGAIKGNRLDLLYPTHEIARQWGVQDLPVVFWQFVETD